MSFSLDNYLQSFLNLETVLDKTSPADFSLNRTFRLLEIFRHPENDLRFVHVAGSKGKGSTCAFLASILRASGYRVGLYTSPHLHSPFERIRVLEPDTIEVSPFEGMASEEDIAKIIEFYKEDIDRLRAEDAAITFYELWTVAAIEYFAQKKVDVVILETGLGGRLDSTNAVDTMVCGITPIGLEHTKLLGDTLAAIAAEKAGIIKASSQGVVIAPQEPEAMEVLRARCAEFFIRPDIVGEGVQYSLCRQDENALAFDVIGRRNYLGLETHLLGEHQAMNAATAIALAEALEVYGFVIAEDTVREGVQSVRWPARFETVKLGPRVILDCAHTVESARVLAQTFRSLYPDRLATLVLGMSRDKDIPAVCRELDRIADKVVLTRADHPRAFDFRTVDTGTVFPAKTVVFTDNVEAALKEACRIAGEDGIVLVCGSVFVCAEARKCATA